MRFPLGWRSGDDRAEQSANQTQAEELKSILTRVRFGYRVTTEDLLKVAPLFRDELTLDSVSRAQLESMSSILGLRTYGTDNMMRNQLRLKIRQLRADDEQIDREGVASMTFEELKQANAYA